MAVIEKDLGPVSAYAVAVAHGYTGTEAEWEALIANSAINAQSAGASATAAAASAQEAAQQKIQAQAQATAAQAHALDAARYAQNAEQANSYAQMASSNAAVSATNASNAQTAAEAAQAAAEAAVTGAEAAQTAAEAAETDAQTAKTAAETAAATAAAAYGTDLLADDYSTSKTYAVGDYCIYSGSLYRCTTAITTGEAWTAAHWTQAQIGPDVSDLKSAVNNIASKTFKPITKDWTAFAGDYDTTPTQDSGHRNGYTANNGGWTINTIHTTYYYKAVDNFDVYFSDYQNTYVCIALYNGAISQANFAKYVRVVNGVPSCAPLDPVIPFPVSEETALHVTAGQTMAISVHTAYSSGFVLQTNSETINGSSTYTLVNTLNLSGGQYNQISEHFNLRRCKVQYKTDLSSESATEGLYIFLPTTSGYVRQQFVHSEDNTKNADNWRMGLVYSCDDALTQGDALTTDGEWECAVRLAQRDDFSGGIAHGDEIGGDPLIFVDGKLTALNSLAEITEFDELRIVTVSQLYDPANHTTVIASHGCERVYTKDGIVVNQTLTWTAAVTATICYMAMFPVKKSVTTNYLTDANYISASIPDGQQVTVGKARKSTLYSASAGFTSEFDTPIYPTGYQNGDYFLMLDNGGGAYNKCYYCITNSSGSVTYEIANGTEWKSQTVYKMTVV